MNNEKLLPCPFCGGKALIKKYEYLTQVFCFRCGASIPAAWYKKAVKAWNTRKPIERIAELLESEVAGGHERDMNKDDKNIDGWLN